MLNHATIDKLRELRLPGMAEALQEQLAHPLPDLDFESRLGMLIEREWLIRENRRLKRRLTQAKLQQSACVEDINFTHPRGLNKSSILELAQGQWVRQHFNLLITGPTGCGKTYIACALAHKACLNGFTSRYYRLPRLWNELKVTKASGTYNQWLASLAKIDILILDDWGITPPDQEQRRDLLEILDDRYQKKSTIITSQLPTSHWHEHLNDATIADAILDRLLHNAIRLELKGESLRKKQNALQTEQP
ncbi:TPA: IS21-like element helper ATPase IstB [Legionella pneumophila]|nr:AAA family ATPase [Legionella pneumophila]